MNEQLRGTGVALVTPFREDTSIDFEGLKKMIAFVTEGNCDYLVILGTTGESPTLSWEEKIAIIEFVTQNNPGNLPLVLGLGGNNTKDITEKLKETEKYPLAAILSVSPYYNKPSQKGLVAHYTAIADHSPFPVILYNVPSRTGSNVSAETTVSLSFHSNIIGTKEASGNLIQCSEILSGSSEDFLLISGDDALTLPVIALGGQGVISVAANLVPEAFTRLVNLALDGKTKEAAHLHNELLPVFDLLGREGNPVSLKTGLATKGLISSHVRLPLVSGSIELKAQFEKILLEKVKN